MCRCRREVTTAKCGNEEKNQSEKDDSLLSRRALIRLIKVSVKIWVAVNTFKESPESS